MTLVDIFPAFETLDTNAGRVEALSSAETRSGAGLPLAYRLHSGRMAGGAEC
jgi:hypothetical protein